jgi:protein virilizer
LDLVQFPNPVYIEEIRIIPLGARVAAQFPGGSNRLGATNPSQFDIEFYVNDLSVEFASTFEPLGKFSYNQNECINLECKPQDGTRKIPTDGLVLKGCYNTITLAVYGNIITYGTMSKIQNNNMSNTGNNNNAVQESSNDEANESENGEIYNSYHNHALNDFQDQNSSCDPTVSSTIDDLKEDDSLQPNSPPVDISSRSPSKEQEIPKNSKREWSMENSSPDGGNYRNKRARLYDRKNPRSPPLQSPRISRPESDDETKKEVGDLSSTFLCPSSPNTPIESPTDELDDAVDLEPILSDEEMIDEEVNGIDDLSEEMFAEEFPVKIFNPFEDELRVVERKLDEIKMTRVQEFLKGLSETTENHDWMQVCEEIHHHLIALKKHEVRAMITNIEDSLKDVIVKAIEKGLNFENAIQQLSPGCNLRYIKAGIKLVESLCFCGNFIMYLNETKNVNIFEKLFILLEVQQIPNPIKILTTRLVHKLIGTKEGVEIFLSFDGYKKVIDKLENTNDVRVLYTFRMILKKIHVFETLSLIRSSTLEIYSKLKNNEEIEFEKISELENLMETLISSRQLDVMQSKKFIPLPSQFELPIEHKSTGFVEFYSHFKLFELIILLIDLRHSISTNLVALVVDYIQLMLKDTLEFDYIANDVKLVNDLIKVLLEPPAIIGSDESQLNLDITLEITYKMESKYHLDWISQINDDDLELAECLESLYNLCMSPGKKHVLEYIALDENLLVFLNIIDKEKQNSILLKQKSPVLTFSIDIVDLVVRYVENLNYLCRYHKFLTTLVKYHESFEPSASAMLQEMGVYLKPLENGKGLVVDDISSYIEIIKRSMEVLTTFPGDLIMTLRILRHLTIGHNLSDYRELKYDFYAIQLYHVDGVSTLLSILDKLTTHFDQPMIHSYLLGANQGQLLMQVIHPTIQVLRKMLVNVIRARNVNFKDITAIETLLKTFTLTNSISRNFKTYKEAKEVQNEIIKILLTYTQSLTPDGMNTTNIHKSLWTQMIGEVIKFTLNGPFHFISGLSVISELLPLPLPVPVLSDLSESEKHQLITERQLWSAHLHPQSNQITELIQTFCTTSTPELMHILYRVCVQLADLAPNMTLLVSKAITEMITNENLGKNGEGTTSLARLIKLLANLVRNACVKVSVLSILNGKLSELLSQLLNHINDDNSEHVTTQYYVVLLINNLLDCEVSLLFNPINSNESSLVSGLPTKELLIQFTKDIVKCFCCTTADNLTYALVQSMILLTEHDITFNVLKFYIITQKDQFSERLNSIGEKCKSEKKLTSIIPDLVELFRALINVEVDMSTRTSSFNIGELSSVLKWNSDQFKNGTLIHFLDIFSAIVNEVKSEDEENSEIIFTEHLKTDLETLLNQLREYSKETPQDIEIEIGKELELNFPQAEGIVTQFSSRVAFYTIENVDDLIIDHWWIDEDEPQLNENVNLDIDEFVKECLPADTNIGSDCKRLLSLSSSPQSSRDRTQAGLCFRTRKVEVAAETRPEKKIFGKCKLKTSILSKLDLTKF